MWWLEQLRTEDHPRLGRKAANLGELGRAGFYVPVGFALEPAAHELFLQQPGAAACVSALEALELDPDDPGGLPAVDDHARSLRRSLGQQPMPDELAVPVVAAYHELGQRVRQQRPRVAVRSSGLQSRPGQYTTRLGVQGRRQLLAAIIEVWASTLNTASLVARRRAGLPLAEDRVGVVIQQLVEASASGVMFTLNPLNGDRSQIVIEAIVGVGMELVAGQRTPQRWAVDRVLLQITEFHPGATAKPYLDDAEVLELARAGKRIEAHMGQAQDIEWALDRRGDSRKRLALLQSRREQVWTRRTPGARLDAGDWGELVCSQFMPLKKT